MSQLLRGLVPALGILFFLAPPAPCWAKTLDSALDDMAQQIGEFFDANGIESTLVDDFKSPADASTGKAVSQTLVGKLSGLGVDKATPLDGQDVHRVDGNFAYDNDRKIVVINAVLHDANNREVERFRQRVAVQEVDSIEDINKLLPTNADFQAATSDVVEEAKADATGGDSSGKVPAIQVSTAANLKKKQLSAIEAGRQDGTRGFDLRTKSAIASSDTSPFLVEILVERGSELVPVEIADLNGFAFAPLAEGDVYRVRIRNEAAHDVSLELNIDGVNTLSLSDAYRDLGRWVVPAGGSILVPGWHRTIRPDGRNEYFKFEVTTEEKGVAREIGLPSGQIGSIHATIHHAWHPAEPTPAIEEAGRVGQTLGLATGRGAVVSVQTAQVSRRHGKQPLASIAIRYQNPDVSDLPDDAPPGEPSATAGRPESAPTL